MTDKKNEPLCFNKRETPKQTDQMHVGNHASATQTVTLVAQENTDRD